MVCIPCLIVPAFLFVWYRFLQPIFQPIFQPIILRIWNPFMLWIWNPFGKIEPPKDGRNQAENDKAQSNGKSCPLVQSNQSVTKEEDVTTNVEETIESKKSQYLLLHEMEFPDTIEGFGYEFSKDGKLQHIETGNPFEFVVKDDDHSYNQKRYEALGELITPLIYNLLEERCELKRYPVPIDAKENEPSTFIFCSEDFQESEKLLILIHGSGVVRAGQWARRLIINDSLDSGTQIPFIERGIKEGYGILVMNTNDNYRDSRKRIRGSETSETHGRYVWKNYVRNCKAKKIAIIAHSYGGVVTTSLFSKFKKEFKERVFAVAMTDSVHFSSFDISYLIQVGRNWVTSQLPLDSPVRRRFKDIHCVSAGCLQHEMTSWSSFESIFRFLHEKLLPVSELLGQETKDPSIHIPHSVSYDEDMPEAREEPMDVETALEVGEDFTSEEANEEGLPEVEKESKVIKSVLEGGLEIDEDFTDERGKEVHPSEEQEVLKVLDSVTETAVDVNEEVKGKGRNEEEVEEESKNMNSVPEAGVEMREENMDEVVNEENKPEIEEKSKDINSIPEDGVEVHEENMDEVVNEKNKPEEVEEESKDMNSVPRAGVEVHEENMDEVVNEENKPEEVEEESKNVNSIPRDGVEVHEENMDEVVNEENKPEIEEESKDINSIPEDGVKVHEENIEEVVNGKSKPEEVEEESENMNSVPVDDIEMREENMDEVVNEKSKPEEVEESKNMNFVPEAGVEVHEENMDEVVNEESKPELTDESKGFTSDHQTAIKVDKKTESERRKQESVEVQECGGGEKDKSEIKDQETIEVQEHVGEEKGKQNGRLVEPTETEEKHVTSSDISHGTSDFESRDQHHQENLENSAKKLKFDDEIL